MGGHFSPITADILDFPSKLLGGPGYWGSGPRRFQHPLGTSFRPLFEHRRLGNSSGLDPAWIRFGSGLDPAWIRFGSGFIRFAVVCSGRIRFVPVPRRKRRRDIPFGPYLHAHVPRITVVCRKQTPSNYLFIFYVFINICFYNFVNYHECPSPDVRTFPRAFREL